MGYGTTLPDPCRLVRQVREFTGWQRSCSLGTASPAAQGGRGRGGAKGHDVSLPTASPAAQGGRGRRTSQGCHRRKNEPWPAPPASRQAQRSHAFFSSCRCLSYSSQVLKARGPGGSESRNSSAEPNRGCGFASKTTITSTCAPSGNSGALISSRWPGRTVVSRRKAV